MSLIFMDWFAGRGEGEEDSGVPQPWRREAATSRFPEDRPSGRQSEKRGAYRLSDAK